MMPKNTFQRLFRSEPTRPSDGEDAVALISAQDRSEEEFRDFDEPLPDKEFRAELPVVNRRWTFSIVALLSLLFLAGLVFLFRGKSFHSKNPASTTDVRTPTDRNLYLILPTSKPDIHTCKTILSSTVLGYPAARYVQWEEDLDQPGREADRAKAKVGGILAALDSFWKNYYDNDTAVILGDQASTWFQLRPEVFFSRYYEIQWRANQQLEPGLEQTILFSSQEICPTYGTDPNACLEEPSAERPDQRWKRVDSRLVIGSVGALKHFYRKALQLLEDDESPNDEVSVFNAILRKQEEARESMRQVYYLSLEADLASDGIGRRDLKPNQNLEYGIGLDYGAELAYAIPSQDATAAWTTASDQMTDGDSLLAADIARSMPPYWTVWGNHPNRHLQWPNISLLTNTETSIASPLLQFDIATEKDAAQDRRKEWWERLWMVPNARELLDASIKIPAVPVSVTVDSNGTEHRIWNPDFDRAGLRPAEGKYLTWKALCGDEQVTAEIFGDNLGPWSFNDAVENP